MRKAGWSMAVPVGLGIVLMSLVGLMTMPPAAAATSNGWSSPTLIDSSASLPSLDSVSCPTTSFCMSVDGNGSAISYHGTYWTSPTSVDGLNSLYAVSCPASTFCMAVDGVGAALTYNGTSWSQPLTVDGTNSLYSVSCPTTLACMAVDSNGNALTYNGTPQAPATTGYGLVAADGGILPFGDAAGYGSTGARTLNKPIVGMASVA